MKTRPGTLLQLKLSAKEKEMGITCDYEYCQQHNGTRQFKIDEETIILILNEWEYSKLDQFVDFFMNGEFFYIHRTLLMYPKWKVL